MEALLLGGLTAIGFYTAEKNLRNRQVDNEDVVTKAEKPNGPHVYKTDIERAAKQDEYEKATDRFQKSLKPYETKIFNDVSKDMPSTIMKKEKTLQYLNSQLAPPTSVKDPSYSQSIKKASDNLISYETIEKEGIRGFNDKRNTTQKLSYTPSSLNTSAPFLVESGNINGVKKHVYMYDNGTHNNMEPFFGGSVKQNTDVLANQNILERHTGANPIYFHKKEVSSFFDKQRNATVFGTKVQKDRQEERFHTTLKRQGIKPFEEIKVPRGLNLSSGTKTNVGFHDMYRPEVKTVNELRVNPKLSYKGRVVGKKLYNDKRALDVNVKHRRQNDTYYSNFDDDSSDRKVRNLIPDSFGGGGRKGKHNDQSSIINQTGSREEYLDRIENFKGGANDTSQGKYIVSKVRTSNKPVYENKHRLQNNTVKGSYTYDQDEWEFKPTIRQQTEDNKHAVINLTTYKKTQKYLYDKAKTTIKEQTLLEEYKGIFGGSQNSKNEDRTSSFNMVFNGLKEVTASYGRDPIKQGVKISNGKDGYNFENTKRTSFDQTDVQRKIGKIYTPTHGIIPKISRQRQVYDNQMYEERTNPAITNQLADNPYAMFVHKLSPE